MVARRTSLRRQRGQNQGNGRTCPWAGSLEFSSGIVDTHNMESRVIRVVILEDRFDIRRVHVAADKAWPRKRCQDRKTLKVPDSFSLFLVGSESGTIFQRYRIG